MTDFQIRIAVIDYGMGNLHSVGKALEQVAPRAEVIVTADPAEIAEADRVVFPGVGAIRDCMAEIRRGGFDAVVTKAINEKPVLGICVGMQALMGYSEENGGVECLNVFPGTVKYFGDSLREADGTRLKVPHMGWNQVHQTIDHPMWRGISQDERFYFVHSYYVQAEGDVTAANCHYGVTFSAALARGNLFAVQFHPEKSHTAGLQLLRNFVNWRGE
ncbi:MAG: imidazole glycerol phosphate synthase subunit HisH [Porticoccaceae bacterium]|jgi:glutamine amidotransferase|nr:imidazole glycerol phosphate synthase subunit HisH [Porticoccaceae bacterium]MEA3300780.1 imidazole glycerol phosphate synthase subunit HisH [Pseudomonadota bacterium]HLS99207.1 imidazole glycerol phosphate synthase subunit HisH [Porticoccaceae bacterium]